MSLQRCVMEQDKVLIEWLFDGDAIRGYGQREKGKQIHLPRKMADDVCKKKWAKLVKSKKGD